MEEVKERHLFAGGNTSRGFYSYYSYIIPQREAEHIYILKGCPGAGKSSVIADIAKKLQTEDISVECFHCPSDPESLDTLNIPGFKTAVIDGTAPHVTDPEVYGAAGEIVNLGEFLNPGEVKAHKEEIIDINEQMERLFRRAYRYLCAAGCVMGDLTDMYGYGFDGAASFAQGSAITEKEFAKVPVSPKTAGTRKQFLSAITPSGVAQYADTLFSEDFKLYLIISNWGMGVSGMLHKIAVEAEARALSTERYYCPMDPESRLEHLIIPGAKIAFISENRYIKLWRRPDAVIDMMGYSDSPHNGKDEIGFAEASMNTLLNEAVFTLKEAKEARDELKNFYIPSMDFEGIKKKGEEIFERIMERAKKDN